MNEWPIPFLHGKEGIQFSCPHNPLAADVETEFPKLRQLWPIWQLPTGFLLQKAAAGRGKKRGTITPKFSSQHPNLNLLASSILSISPFFPDS
jgi:hypothetical protein